jgi:hypothetical protein
MELRLIYSKKWKTLRNACPLEVLEAVAGVSKVRH